MALSLLGPLSTSYVLPGAIVAPVPRSAVVMNEAAAKAAWLAKQDQSLYGSAPAGAPPRPYTPAASPPPMDGARNPIFASVWKAMEKAKKGYVGKEVEICGERKAKGWTIGTDHGKPHGWRK